MADNLLKCIMFVSPRIQYNFQFSNAIVECLRYEERLFSFTCTAWT
jgi:hypothetical protein